MTYCTRADLVDRFGADAVHRAARRDVSFESSSPHADASADSEGRVIQCAIADAVDKINGHLRGIYPVPLSDVPTSIKRCAVDIAWYYLHPTNVPELVQTRFDDADKWLILISQGKVRLGVRNLNDTEATQPGVGKTAGFDGTRPKAFTGGKF